MWAKLKPFKKGKKKHIIIKKNSNEPIKVSHGPNKLYFFIYNPSYFLNCSFFNQCWSNNNLLSFGLLATIKCRLTLLRSVNLI